VFGFREALVVPGDGGDVVHAELRWSEGGGVMLGSTKFTEGSHAVIKPGVNAVYVVTDDVDGVYARLLAAGAEIADELQNTDYGSHTFTTRDPEGKLSGPSAPTVVRPDHGYCTLDEFFRPSVSEGSRSVSRVFLARWWCVAASRCAAAR
jgi:uncharacterized glyoxalase superfamily protein PhnB